MRHSSVVLPAMFCIEATNYPQPYIRHLLDMGLGSQTGRGRRRRLSPLLRDYLPVVRCGERLSRSVLRLKREAHTDAYIHYRPMWQIDVGKMPQAGARRILSRLSTAVTNETMQTTTNTKTDKLIDASIRPFVGCSITHTCNIADVRSNEPSYGRCSASGCTSGTL